MDKDDDGLGTIEEDILLCQFENTMPTSVNLRGVKGVQRALLNAQHRREIIPDGHIEPKASKEWVLEPDDVSLK